MQARDLDGLSRSDLIAKAEELGVEKANVLTRAELSDEILRRSVSDPIERRLVRGLLGIARDLVARVVERGLHLPDAAEKIRSVRMRDFAPPKPPIATVTLAEIYAAQGHRTRALSVLDEVLSKEEDHAAARDLRDKIVASPEDEPVMPPEPEEPISEDRGGSPTLHEATNDVQASPAEPIGMLDDQPLPELYDVDEVVLMPVDPRTVYAYWEVREASVALARTQAEGGRLILRIVAVTASWEGPSVETRDIEVNERVGDWFVRDLPPGAVLRAALGWRAATGFEPLSVAMELSAPVFGPAAIGANELVELTPAGMVSIDGLRSDAEAMAAATERARRRVARGQGPASQASSSWPALMPSPAGTLETWSSSSSMSN
jgi:hypothetical protein